MQSLPEPSFPFRTLIKTTLFLCFTGGSLAAQTFNVMDFGAKADCQRVLDGVMMHGSSQLTSATANFAGADVGKPIYVLDAGASTYLGRQVLYGNLPLDTTIAAVIDSHTALLATAALNSVSGVSVTWGTDDTVAIQNTIESAAAAGGGIVFFPAGMYRVTSHIAGGFGAGFTIDGSHLRLTGTGDTSRILNSSVYSFMTAGTTYYHETGATVAFLGSSQAVEDIEIDHLWFGDNGEQFHYTITGPNGPVDNPEGPGVLETVGIVNNIRLHDLTVVTSELCGIDTDAEQSDGILIDHVVVQSNGGNHGFYLGGQKTNLSLSNSVVTSLTTPMRIGVVLKAGSYLSVLNNRITNFAQQGIGIDANTAQEVVDHVTISGNFIYNGPLTQGATQPVNTHGIQLNNGANILIERNRIMGMNYSGVYTGADLWPISNIAIRNNLMENSQFYGITASFVPVSGVNDASSDLLSNIEITGNTVVGSPTGIYQDQAAGNVSLTANCVSGGTPACAMSFNLRPAASADFTFSDNTAVNCAGFNIPVQVQGNSGNQLQARSCPVRR